MKFTIVFITLLCLSTSLAIKSKTDELKNKRETYGGYPGISHSSQSYPAPSFGQEEASSISVGAGYSIGGGKPSYNFGAQGSGAGYQLSAENLPSSSQNIQLAPITLQPSHGSLVGTDLSQLMSQLSQGLNSGAITLQQGGQGASYQLGNLGAHGGQELAVPQYSYGAPKLQQQFALYDQSQGVPAYAAGTKGLSSYGSTGPVLFSPSESQSNQAALNYGAQSAGPSVGNAGSFSVNNADHSLSGFSLGNSGQLLGGQYNSLGASYSAPGKAGFKPSAFLGSSVQSDSGHGLAGLSGSYAAAPSFGSSHGLSGSHGGFALNSGRGASFGGSLGNFGGSSSKLLAPSYLPAKSEGFGSQESIAAFSSSGHLESPPATTYGIPSGSFAQASSSNSPQYYVSSSKHSLPSVGFNGGSSYRGPSSGYSSLNSYSSGPKYSISSSGSRYGPPKDSHGAYSESSYNTIKYSEELKPRVH
ncbi:prisilkin-39-like [Battus philenor]|uniref:prisilkin-39-like n=1 Tax=Battus philenor TaxID=42288 RepID=UPI0035D08374